MNATFFPVVASTLLAASTMAHASCSLVLNGQLANARQVVNSLRPDKPGQMRVFASDGSEYTAPQALWMKGQMQSILRACAQSDESTATSILHGVVDLMNSHHHTS
jgi:hypothetical protein